MVIFIHHHMVAYVNADCYYRLAYLLIGLFSAYYSVSVKVLI